MTTTTKPSRRATFDLGSPERAHRVFAALTARFAGAADPASVHTPLRGLTTVGALLSLPRTQLGLLAGLPEDAAGHVDADGAMWSDGTVITETVTA